MTKSHLVHCPFCKSALEVEAATGKLLNQWEHKKSGQSTTEKFSQAMEDLKEGKKKRDEFFSSAAEKMEEKKKKTDKLFGEGLKKIKEEGLGERPPNPFDLD
ncbi:MAG: hypothetical protein HY401_08095 [Elusimicrobia bacterium]|nr:hypothetical protein [Elusimicrobiota bacterium]